MELKHIEVFLAIVEQQSVTRAAEALYLSQSTVSHRLSALEKELNTTLISRGKGISSITLTAKGRDFVPIAQRWLTLYRDTSKFQTSDTALPLRVAAPYSINAYVLGELYAEVVREERKLLLQVRTCQPDEMVPLLENDGIDVAFSFVPLNNNSFKTEAKFEEEMVLVERAAVRRPELIVHPASLDPSLEIYISAPSHITSWHDNWFDPSSPPQVWLDSPMMISRFLDREGCWCMVSRWVADHLARQEGVHVYNFSAPPPNVICYMTTHRFPKHTTVDALRLFGRYLEKLNAQ